MLYEVIIPAAGQGKRMNAGQNKLFIKLAGIPIIVHTLRVFERDPNCKGIILCINPMEENLFKDLIIENGFTKITELVPGGAERQYSVYNGLKHVDESVIALIHDGARPFITHQMIQDLSKAAADTGGAIAEEGFLGTDDASLLERIGAAVEVIEGSYDNIKITTQEDLYFAEAILNKNDQ